MAKPTNTGNIRSSSFKNWVFHLQLHCLTANHAAPSQPTSLTCDWPVCFCFESVTVIGYLSRTVPSIARMKNYSTMFTFELQCAHTIAK